MHTLQAEELCDAAADRVPDVDVGAQRHGQVVVGAPVHQVEVVVVEDVRGVQNPLRRLHNSGMQ